MISKPPRRLYKTVPLGLCAVAALMLVVGGLGYYRSVSRTIQAEKAEELKTIAELKVRQIVSWRKERLADVQMNSSGIVRAEILQWLASADDVRKDAIRAHWMRLREMDGYQNIILSSTDGRILLQLNEQEKGLEMEAMQLADQAIAAHAALFGDFFRCTGSNLVHLDVAAPVRGQDARPVAVLILRISPENFLYPLIQSWPTASRSGETLLVRGQGGHVLFLNTLRHSSDPALSVRIPLTRTEVPAVHAVLGKIGGVRGSDYRGEDVVADIRPVDGSPWYIVAKMDSREISAEARSRGLAVLLLVFLGIVITAILSVLLLNRRQSSLYKNLYNAEQQLSRSRAIMAASNDAVFVIDPATARFVDVNDAACARMGYSREDLLNMCVRDVDPGFSVEDWSRHVRHVSERGSLLFETHYRKKDGSQFPVEVGVRFLCMDGSNYLVAAARDISERKAAEEALRQSERRLQVLMDSLPGMAYRCINAPGWPMQFVSQGCAALTGYTSEELTGGSAITYEDLIHPEDREAVFLAVQEAVRSGRPFQLEYRITTKDGREKHVWEQGRLVSEPDLQEQWLEGLVADITERKRLEMELQTLNRDLVRSNEELEQFAYVASHDLQEPLRMVSSYTQLLAKRYKDKLDQDAKEFIHYAVDGANRMQRMIHDLLAYSRVTTRGQPQGPLDANVALREALRNLQVVAEEAGARITNEVLPMIVADRTQIVQLFQNLVGNAIKFHKPGEPPCVHIGAERKAEQPRFWIFKVKDQGIGIESKYFDRLFVIFQRLHGKQEYPGTGIGLALCRRIVERHGGTIWLESEHGCGTTFFFTLPDLGEE